MPQTSVHFTAFNAESDPEQNSFLISIEEFVDQLMGRRAEKRFEFIQANASYAKDLDI